MIKRTVILAAALCAASSLAQAQDWKPVARQCGEQFATWWRSTHGAPCASCSAGWPDIARCTAKTVDPNVSSDLLEACIRQVNDEDWGLPMSTDRIGPVIVCLGRRAAR